MDKLNFVGDFIVFNSNPLFVLSREEVGESVQAQSSTYIVIGLQNLETSSYPVFLEIK